MGFFSTPAGAPLVGSLGFKNKYFNPMGYIVDQYNSNKNKPEPLPTPKPRPETTPPTMADAISSTKQDVAPKKATAGGTIGDMGPEGLTAPAKTANLTLLGGTK